MIYLIEYNRKTGKLLRLEEFQPTDRRQAEEKRLHVELELLRTGLALEVVLLEASSKDELRKTHRRYFERIEQLLSPSQAADA
jgi:hypothetical protein